MKKFVLISLLLHVALFASFFASNWFSKSFQSVSAQKKPEIIRAKMVEATDVVPKQATKPQKTNREEASKQRILEAKRRVKKAEERLKLERKKKADVALKKQKELEKKRKKLLAEKKRKKIEETKQAKLAEKKKQVLLQKKAEEKRKEEQRKKDEEKKRLAAEAKAKKLAEEKRKAQAARKAEQARTAQAGAEHNSRMAQYIGLIRSKMRQHWRAPLGSSGKQTTVKISLLPNGFVTNVELVKSSGSRAFDNSVQDALWNAGELPIPKDPQYAKLFTEEPVTMRFTP